MKIFKVLKNFYGFPVGVAEPAEGSRVLPSGGEIPEKCKQWEEQRTLVTTLTTWPGPGAWTRYIVTCHNPLITSST